MSKTGNKILLYGYGNPGRLDDGLGPAVIEYFEANPISGVTLDSNYQLCLEDAAAVAEHDAVVFVDADVGGREPFSFEKLEPKNDASFSTHSISPVAVLYLAENMLKSKSEGYMLGIRGYEFNEFGEVLCEKAKNNMKQAIDFIKVALEDGQLSKYATESTQRGD